jgi:hypothetical protein
MKRKFQVLREMVDKISYNLLPEGNERSYVDAAKDPNGLGKLFEKYPKCYIPMNAAGDPNPLYVPVCNRSALADPKVIEISQKVLQKLRNGYENGVDVKSIESMIVKLEKIKADLKSGEVKQESGVVVAAMGKTIEDSLNRVNQVRKDRKELVLGRESR